MARKAKLLAIGLDALEQSLVRQWMESGELPALASLQERAVRGSTTNEPGLYTGSVWGCYYYRQIVNGTYNTVHFLPEHLKHPPFWKALSDQGLRVAVIDVPKSMLTENLNGIQVVDWGLHDPSFASAWIRWANATRRTAAQRNTATCVTG
jgi:predicted AlkP superfamily phosphohydrolase/phosphomutase